MRLEDAALAGGLLLLLAGIVATLHVLRRRLPHSLETHQQAVAVGPFTFLITLYAFLLGFIVVNLWQTYQDAGRNAEQEAETVGTLYRLTESWPEAKAARSLLVAYIGSVIRDEWPSMAAGRASPKTEELYRRIWRDFHALDLRTPKDQALYAEILRQLGRLTDLRRARLLLLEGTIPPVLWWSLATGGLLLLVGLHFLGIVSASEQIAFDVTVVGMLLLTLYLAVDFNGVFSGRLRIRPTAFEAIEADLNPGP
jgi:hypothetical protein